MSLNKEFKSIGNLSRTCGGGNGGSQKLEQENLVLVLELAQAVHSPQTLPLKVKELAQLSEAVDFLQAPVLLQVLLWVGAKGPWAAPPPAQPQELWPVLGIGWLTQEAAVEQVPGLVLLQ